MDILQFDLKNRGAKFKRLNATNGGPVHKRHASDQPMSNLENYRAARIPYARNHDSNYMDAYGGPYAHDISAIFPNFDADVNDPASYDFACTDESILVCLEAGTKTFFRLGQSIEHQIKKHGTLPPRDFRKWAEICEHIIRHYTEGWADGMTLDMDYWEIWNEPDLAADDSKSINKLTWGGTKAQFFDLYEITAKHLKACFPHLKIGGPALAGNLEWAADFLSEMRRRGVEIDFFSWHIYLTEPEKMLVKAEAVQKLLEENGYGNAENILNEWNYVESFSGKEWPHSLQVIMSMKGAALMMACISAAQDSPIDMLMYYDTRPGGMNGVFANYTHEPLKGYYPLKWYGMFYDMDAEIKCGAAPAGIYPLCGVGKDGKTLCVITYYTNDKEAKEKDLRVDFGRSGQYEIFLLDEEHDGELVKTTSDLSLTLDPNTCVLIQEI